VLIVLIDGVRRQGSEAMLVPKLVGHQDVRAEDLRAPDNALNRGAGRRAPDHTAPFQDAMKFFVSQGVGIRIDDVPLTPRIKPDPAVAAQVFLQMPPYWQFWDRGYEHVNAGQAVL